MNIYRFNFSNYYSGNRSVCVLSYSEDSAYDLLLKDNYWSRYIKDEETDLINVIKYDTSIAQIL